LGLINSFQKAKSLTVGSNFVLVNWGKKVRMKCDVEKNLYDYTETIFQIYL